MSAPSTHDERLPDDVKFTRMILEDLSAAATVDPKRTFATGMSNGAMMCYRLAADMPEKFSAIAPVSGVPTMLQYHPAQPISVIHFHGTADTYVAMNGTVLKHKLLKGMGVEETAKLFAKLDGCDEEPKVEKLPASAHDGTSVTRKSYTGKNGDVVLYVIEGGGHTWPGRNPVVKFLGPHTENICANDLIWEFFEKHPRR